MAGETKEDPKSQFNARADNAALALRKDLQQRGVTEDARRIPDSRSVPVGPDGKPPQPLPPEGSYMRQAIERRRAQQEAEKVLGDQPPAGTSEQMVDGSQAPPIPQEPQDTDEPLSPKAQRRIRELTEQLRRMDQDRQQALENAKRNEESTAELRDRLTALEREREQMLQANLENLDPETRLQVMQDARLQEAISGLERRIMDRIMPHVQGLEQQNAYSEMMRLGEVYPAFDVQIHGHLIDMFRGKNPNCTVEQAFRAIAEPEELVTRQAAGASAVPPIVPPGNGTPAPRYMPEPNQNQSSPEEELVEESQRLKQLMASGDPTDHRTGMRLAHDHLAKRLAHKLPR